MRCFLSGKVINIENRQDKQGRQYFMVHVYDGRDLVKCLASSVGFTVGDALDFELDVFVNRRGFMSCRIVNAKKHIARAAV